MIVNYVLKNFRRRKVRTILMVLALAVSTGLIVAMSATVETLGQSSVDLISAEAGYHDLGIRKSDISSDPFVTVSTTAETILAADPRIEAVYPRYEVGAEFGAGSLTQDGTLVVLDTAEDQLGTITVREGDFSLGDNRVALFESTAGFLDVDVGDSVQIAYSFPQPREKGRVAAVDSSSRRSIGDFTVAAIVTQSGVVGSSVRSGAILDYADMQAWINLPDRAQQLVVRVDPSLYEARNSETAVLALREIASRIQAELGDEYDFLLEKALSLDSTVQVFIVLQALINTYGLMSLAVVGLLIHTLVMTNVQEQRREMAVLRILGSQRGYLFTLVLAEVLIIGLIGVGLGIFVGQAITRYAVVPLLEYQLSQAGDVAMTLTPAVTMSVILPAVLSALVVLLLSALKPAQDAASTKVMHAINPGVADNIQLEDLDALRESRPNRRFFMIGVIMLSGVAMAMMMEAAGNFGNLGLQATLMLSMLLMMTLSIGLIFFIFTRPLERLILLPLGWLIPRLTYFAQRNVRRSRSRNTLIALLVLFSGVLPSFLATQSALDAANLESNVRLQAGAPIRYYTIGTSVDGIGDLHLLSPSFLTQELGQVAGLAAAVGITEPYESRALDAVGMRDFRVDIIGIEGDLNEVVYTDMVIPTAGSAESLTQLVQQPDQVVISEGLAGAMKIGLGDTLYLKGEGLDHQLPLTIVGIARRVPGFSGFGRSSAQARGGSTVLVSLDTYRRLRTELNDPLPDANARMLDNVMMRASAEAPDSEVASALRQDLGKERVFWLDLAEERLRNTRNARVQEQAILLVMTLISFTTAVFGVFAVIYVTVYSRRIEIGMLKAIGMRNRELTGMLIVEAIAMTLSAALAGIMAGATMGYLFTYYDYVNADRPLAFAVDLTVMPFVVVMVVLASIIGTIFSARRIVKKKAVEILRM